MLELAKEMDELASDIVVCGMVPNDVSLRQVVERLLKELGRGCTEKKRLHTMKVFDYADKKKLLFCPLSWLTELLRLVVYPKQTLERVYQGVDREWPAWQRRDTKFRHRRTRKKPWILLAWKVQNRKAQSEEHSDLLSARDAVPSQDEEDGETETPHLKADAMWKSHLICGHGSVHLEGVIGVFSC